MFGLTHFHITVNLINEIGMLYLMAILDAISWAFQAIYDVKSLIAWGGLGLICLIIFIESGLFIGFFLPGDSLLITAGIFAAAGYLDIWWLLILATVCAILGDQVNYYFGKKAGKAIFNREDSFFFHRKHIERAK